MQQRKTGAMKQLNGAVENFAYLSSAPGFWENFKSVDYFAMVYLHTFVLGAFLSAFITVPLTCRGQDDLISSQIKLAVLAYLQVLINFYMVVKTSKKDVPVKINNMYQYNGNGGNSFIEPGSNPKGYCDKCQTATPIRAHHCQLCQVCVLKRDHHCFFAGCCIGLHNQRYFIVFLFYITVAGFVSAWYEYQLVSLLGPSPFGPQFYMYIFPFDLYFIFNDNIQAPAAITALYMWMTIAGCFVAGAYFIVQMTCVLRGQTMYELMRGNRKFKLSMLQNFKSTFGKQYGFMNFFFPCPWLESPDDGYTWRGKHESILNGISTY